MMEPSKGGNSIANAFLNNTATQAPASLPQIQAPQSLLPMGPMPLPQPSGPAFGSLYPGPNMKPAAPIAPDDNMPKITGMVGPGVPVFGRR